MTTLGHTIAVTGDIQVSEDITVEGHVQGAIYGEPIAVTILASAEVKGDVIARDITVFGTVDGSLVATEVVDLRAGASVTGRIVAQRLILNEGALFNGRVEPQHLDAALKVARHRRGVPEPAPDVSRIVRGERPPMTVSPLRDRLPAR